MAQMIADLKDIEFVLFDQFKVDRLSQKEPFADFNRKTVELVVREARNLAIKEILPTQKIGDQEGARFDQGEVRVPEAFQRAWELLKEGEWIAMSEPLEWGGQAMPRSVSAAAGEYLNGANLSFMMYAALTHGAGLLVETFGTDEQKRLFLKNMYTGKWTGTMLLTEPQAGTDVGALTTSAVPNDDGTYAISGSKIFISSGEHDLAENIIHPVLARIEGAPAGTRGISLFLVPKFWVNDDGTLGDFNDVVCTGIEEKMGLHGNATCSLTLGGKGECRGLLLGEVNKGMKAMFVMMNAARFLVGLQGFSLASASYINAVNYARERIQGRHLLKFADRSAPAVPIIEHPDVRRMLLTMKGYVEGMRSLLYYVGLLEDHTHVSDDEVERRWLQGMVDLLIPICKGYVTDRAFEVCSTGVQVYGGYGYISEYPQEQLLRDCRITLIYEGTNGIQAMDLLARKMGSQKGTVVMDLVTRMQRTVAEAEKLAATQALGAQFKGAVAKLLQVGQHIGSAASGPKMLAAFAFAHPFMEVVGDTVMTWMLLWRAVTAAKKLEGKVNKKEVVFCEGQIKTAEHFMRVVMPATLGKMDAVLALNAATVEMDEAAFGGK